MGHLDSNTVYLDEYYTLHYPDGAHHGYDAPEEILAMANPKWLDFPPVHPFVQHSIGLLFMLLFVASVVGNSIVMYIFLKVKTLRTPTNMLIVALALSDLIMMIHQAPPLFISMMFSKYWIWGKLACSLYGFLGGVNGNGSLWLIIMIGYDRYNVIVKGLSGTKITSGIAFGMILFSFTYSTCTVLPAFLEVWSTFSLEGLLNTCSFEYLTDTFTNKSFVLFIFFFNFCVPLMFILFFYSGIVKAVVNHEKALKAQAKKMNVESLRSNADADKESAEVRIAKVALTAVSLWLCAWSPYACVVLLGQFGPTGLITPIIAQVPSMMCKTACCFNPIIYAISHPKYREALAAELPCLGIGDKVEVKPKEETKAISA